MTHDLLSDSAMRKQTISILLVSGEPDTKESVCHSLPSHFELEICDEVDFAIVLLGKRQTFDCVLVDMKLPGDETLRLLRSVRQHSRGLPIMLMCSAAEISTAVEGIRSGATDFVIKEVEIVNLAERIAKVTGRSAKKLKGMPCSVPKGPEVVPNQMVVGRSPRMLEVMEMARRAASYPVPILLLGESGTGKGLFSHWIHRMSKRSEGPFAAVNLAAIPSDLVESTLFGHEKGAFTGAVGNRVGKFSQAQKGTLLLDEITEIGIELQPKLLRVLQEGEFERVGGEQILRNEARIISATNQNISELVKRGEFRSDLFYRLNLITITLPPLRERQEDIPDLVKLFLAKYNKMYECQLRGVTEQGMEALMDHDWPGNIRELEHTIQRAMILSDGDYADEKDLFDAQGVAQESLTSRLAEQGGTLEELEREYIEVVLRRTDQHQGQAAKVLGIDRKTLYNKIMKYGLRRSLESKENGASKTGTNSRGDLVPTKNASAS